MESEALFEAIVARDVPRALSLLKAEPALATARETRLGSTALHFAAHRGLVEVVAALLAAGADVNAREAASGTTPMHWAAEAGHLEVARRLGRAGADLTAVDEWYGLTPLGWATVVDWAPAFRADRPATIAALRRAGARPDLFVAIAEDKLDEVSMLCDPDQLGRRLGFVGDGWTPLHLAADRGAPVIVTMLYTRGADAHARSDSGLTPLAVARRARNTAAARALRPAHGEDDASVALVTGDYAALASAKMDADLATRLLGAAARDGRAEAVPLLARRGANPNARLRDLVGERPTWITPLHVAAKHGHAATVTRLLDAGARVDARGEAGGPTAIEVATDPAVIAVLKKRAGVRA